MTSMSPRPKTPESNDDDSVVGAAIHGGAIDMSRFKGIDTSGLIGGLDMSRFKGIDTSGLIGGLDMSRFKGIDTSGLIGGLDMSRFKGIDTSGLIGGLDMSRFKGIDTSGLIDTSWVEEFAQLVRNRFRGLPANWWEVTVAADLEGDQLRSILLEEGIPLAWVPNAALIDRLLAAADAKQRRELIRNGWRGIVRDCVRVAGELPSQAARMHARFIGLGASATRDGHYEAAQALAANLVDTLGRSFVRRQTVRHQLVNGDREESATETLHADPSRAPGSRTSRRRSRRLSFRRRDSTRVLTACNCSRSFVATVHESQQFDRVDECHSAPVLARA